MINLTKKALKVRVFCRRTCNSNLNNETKAREIIKDKYPNCALDIDFHSSYGQTSYIGMIMWEDISIGF